MSRGRLNPPEVALWLCNCYSAQQEMRHWGTGSQFGSSQNTLSLQRNYTVPQNQRLPFFKTPAKLQRAETRPVKLPPVYNYSWSSEKRAEPCLAVIRPLDMGHRTTISGVCVGNSSASHPTLTPLLWQGAGHKTKEFFFLINLFVLTGGWLQYCDGFCHTST